MAAKRRVDELRIRGARQGKVSRDVAHALVRREERLRQSLPEHPISGMQPIVSAARRRAGAIPSTATIAANPTADDARGGQRAITASTAVRTTAGISDRQWSSLKPPTQKAKPITAAAWGRSVTARRGRSRRNRNPVSKAPATSHTGRAGTCQAPASMCWTAAT